MLTATQNLLENGNQSCTDDITSGKTTLQGEKQSVANAKQHMAIGAGVAVAGYLAYCYFKDKKVDGLELVGFGLIGVGAGLLPDLLEPAIHSHHRQFFHSYAVAGLLAYSNRMVWKSPLVPREQKLAFSIATSSYFSHLIADSQTPRGIPLVGHLGL